MCIWVRLVVPYATLDPLKAVLPLKRGAVDLPSDKDDHGRERLEGLERRMRQRWRIINDLWEHNKAAANRLDLIGRSELHGEPVFAVGMAARSR